MTSLGQKTVQKCVFTKIVVPSSFPSASTTTKFCFDGPYYFVFIWGGGHRSKKRLYNQPF